MMVNLLEICHVPYPNRMGMEMTDWHMFRNRNREFALSYFPPPESGENRSA